jgi:type IV secretory pathway TrbL component
VQYLRSSGRVAIRALTERNHVDTNSIRAADESECGDSGELAWSVLTCLIRERRTLYILNVECWVNGLVGVVLVIVLLCCEMC